MLKDQYRMGEDGEYYGSIEGDVVRIQFKLGGVYVSEDRLSGSIYSAGNPYCLCCGRERLVDFTAFTQPPVILPRTMTGSMGRGSVSNVFPAG
jgi:hypothetical protein